MILTHEQQQAVDAGPMVAVTAAAGSGKTRVIIARISKLITDGADPEKIVAITFTRKAAGEIVHRLKKEGITIGFCGTVHSWLLKKINDSLPDHKRLSVCPQELFQQMVKKALEESGSRMSFDSSMEHSGEWKYPIERNVIKNVRQLLEVGGLIDYEEILRHASDAGFVSKHNLFQDTHLLVDEFQDTGVLERIFYEQIKPETMMIVSDHRQTLYGFRGADAESPKKMAVLKHLTQVELTRNFRCTEEIQDFASLALNGHRDDCKFELQEIALRIFASTTLPDAILCGTNDTVDRLTKELNDRGIPVVGRSMVTEQQKDLEALIRWKIDPENDLLLVNLLSRVDPDLLKSLRERSTERLCEIGDMMIPGFEHRWPIQRELEFLAEVNPEATLSELAELAVEMPETTGRIVCTIHSAKGLEWDSVVVVDDMCDSEHHRRMRYVAMTRARKNLSVYRLRERWGR